MTAEGGQQPSLTAGDRDAVTVIVPTYYRNDTLAEAIESVYRQEYRPIELIVVDDSGEAHAEPVVEKYDEVTYVPLAENGGAQAARNVGFERTTGAYVQFLDDDDRLRPDKFTTQVARFTDSVGVVYSALGILETEEVIPPKPEVRGDVLEYALQHALWPCSNCTMLMKRSLLDEVMPVDHEHAADDVGLQIEMARRTEFEYVDEPLIYSRNDLEDSLSASPEYFESRLQLVSEYSDLYDRYPEYVRKRALSGIHRAKAEQLMAENDWSVEAIKSYGLSAYYAPSDRPLKTAEFALSVFGSTGLEVADQLRRVSRKHLT
ncbi:glycosyltransferase family 2 protein [Halorussus litoreus]|uniref:glycosyltransferase family 2 protein n=1 Tax=Halorussus litoreus TaxID=1710536 RepID=UPI0013001C12|nr:glycosyltransferase family 2 protein [Halorussus litoreus]